MSHYLSIIDTFKTNRDLQAALDALGQVHNVSTDDYIKGLSRLCAELTVADVPLMCNLIEAERSGIEIDLGHRPLSYSVHIEPYETHTPPAQYRDRLYSMLQCQLCEMSDESLSRVLALPDSISITIMYRVTWEHRNTFDDTPYWTEHTRGASGRIGFQCLKELAQFEQNRRREIRIICRACRVLYKVDKSHAGRRATCPGCSSLILVEDALPKLLKALRRGLRSDKDGLSALVGSLILMDDARAWVGILKYLKRRFRNVSSWLEQYRKAKTIADKYEGQVDDLERSSLLDPANRSDPARSFTKEYYRQMRCQIREYHEMSSWLPRVTSELPKLCRFLERNLKFAVGIGLVKKERMWVHLEFIGDVERLLSQAEGLGIRRKRG